jgi:lysophospholipase L1-like esterase
MGRNVSLVRIIMAAVTVGATIAAVPALTGLRWAGHPGDQNRTGPAWVDSWVAMPQLTEPGNLPPAPFTQPGAVLVNSTLRQTLHTTIGGTRIRLRFSNAFGDTDLPLTRVAVARPAGGGVGTSAIQPGTSRPVTFDGKASIVVPVGAQVVSDPIAFPVPAGSNLTVTTYLATGQPSNNITSHPGSRTTSYMLTGDHVTDTDLTGTATADHWYFLDGLETLSPSGTAAVVTLGDSLTDGRGSTTNGNDRWPDQLAARLRADRATAHVGVANEAAGGNRVLHDGLGPNALGRIDRDVLAQSGVRWLIVFEGVNDIGTADATPAAQAVDTAALETAFQQIVVRAHAQGIKVYGATITPFGGNTGYDDPTGYREAARQAVNAWIRTSGEFDAVLDFDKVVRDPAVPRNISPVFDVGDHLHLNPAGYGALANAVPARLFN